MAHDARGMRMKIELFEAVAILFALVTIGFGLLNLRKDGDAFVSWGCFIFAGVIFAYLRWGQ